MTGDGYLDIDLMLLAGDRRRPCRLRFAPAGVALYVGKKAGVYPWEQVRRIDFDDPGRTKANPAMIALFGVLGMASRRAFTIITLATASEDVYFEHDTPVGQWRGVAGRISEIVPAAAGRVFVDGAPANAAYPAPAYGQQSGIAPAPQVPGAAGWYPDPLGRSPWRWFDGAQWTDHVSDGSTAGTATTQ